MQKKKLKESKYEQYKIFSMYWRFFPPRCYTTLPFSLYRHWQMMKSSAKNFGNSSVLMLILVTDWVPNTIYNADFFQILNLALDTLDFNFIRLLRCIHSLYLNEWHIYNQQWFILLQFKYYLCKSSICQLYHNTTP